MSSLNLKPYEVIVIGSGATGGVAALTLAKAGIKVLVIEAGPDLSLTQAFGSELRNSFNRLTGILNGDYRNQAQHPGFWKANPLLYANEKENRYLNPKDRPFLWTQGRQVGGKSLTWGGITLRLSDYDFNASKNDGYGPSWPIDYSDLSPHYSQLEHLFRVYGNKDGLEQLPDGEYVGNSNFTESENYLSEIVKNRFGYPFIHSRGFESYIYQNDNTNWPRYSSPGCTLKIALSTGNVEILTAHIAERLIMNKQKDKASGIIAVNKKDNTRIILNSKLIIVCASTIQTLRFLLSSEESNQSNGFIEESGKLGKSLMDHVSTCRFFSLPKKFLSSEKVNKGPKQTLSGAGSFFIPFGNKPGIFKDADFIRGYGIWGGLDRFEIPSLLKGNINSSSGFLIGHGEVLANERNKVTLSTELDEWGLNIPHIDCRWGENEKRMVRHMNKTIEKIIITSGGKIINFNNLINFPLLNILTRNIVAVQKEAPPPGYYIHEVGGAPMGFSEESSVVDKWNRLWNCKNVLVVDGSCWPTSAWQSPTLTMMAITRRACLNSIKNWKD